MRAAVTSSVLVIQIALMAGSVRVVDGAELILTPREVFVTSVQGAGNLSTWPDAGGASGLAAGDAICRARAQAAGLAESSTYVAWLSSSTTDAYCRVHGLTGKKSANCGQATLPATAGPWVRMDGFPFAGTIAEAMRPTGRVLVPVAFNEFGVATYGYYFTNTDEYGELAPRSANPCANWTSSAAASVEAGNPTDANDYWTMGLVANCSDPHPLLCIQSGPGSPLPPYRSGGALVFVTSTNGPGRTQSWPLSDGLVGLQAADHVCRNLATAADLPKPSSFVAWLSTATIDAVDRVSFGGPWVRPDGVKVADSKADLSDGTLDAPINVTEAGDYVPRSQVWTGTGSAGTGSAYHCSAWTSSSSATWGTEGIPGSAFWSWTDSADDGCEALDRMYCFSELATIVFVDDFESAGTTAWSGTVTNR